MIPPLTFAQLLAYAEWLAERHDGTSVEFLSIFEMWPDYVDLADGLTYDSHPDIEDDDARAVDKLLRHATVTITWPTEIPEE